MEDILKNHVCFFILLLLLIYGHEDIQLIYPWHWPNKIYYAVNKETMYCGCNKALYMILYKLSIRKQLLMSCTVCGGGEKYLNLGIYLFFIFLLLLIHGYKDV